MRTPLTLLAAVALAGSALAIAPGAARGQLVVGVHAVEASKTLGGATGAGLRAGLDLPLLPFDLLASGEYFFPDCPDERDGCSFWGATLDANVGMILPIVTPYVSGGLAYRSLKRFEEDDAETATGASVGAGVTVSLGGLRGFAEVRYELVEIPDEQTLIRVGLLLGVP